MPRTHSSGGSRRKSRLNGWVKWGFLALFAAVGLYNLLLGSWFITRVAFPIASELLKYNISADSVEISLATGRVRIRHFRFGPGWDPIVQAPEVTCRVSRKALLRGELKLLHVRADYPEVSVSRTQSGYYNVNKVRKAPRPPDPPGPVVFDAGDELPIQIEDVQITNGRFRLDYVSNRGVREVSMTAFPTALRLDRFRPGELMHIEADCRGSFSTYSLELIDFRLRIVGDAGFSPYGLPNFASGTAVVTGMEGRAGNIDLKNRTLAATGEASGENVLNALQVKYIDVNISDASTGKNSHIRVDGDLNFYPWKMVSHAEFTPIDDELFNYFNDYFGVPLRNLVMNSNNRFELDYETAQLIGTLELANSEVRETNSYDLEWKIEEDAVSAREFKAACYENSVERGNFVLTSPLTLDFHGDECRFVTFPELIFNLNRFDLKKIDIPYLPDGSRPSGEISAAVKLIPEADVREFSVSGHLIGEALELRTDRLGSFRELNCNVSLNGKLAAGGVLRLEELVVGIFGGGARLFAVRSENCYFDLTNGGFGLTAKLSGLKDELLDLPPIAEKLAIRPAIREVLRRQGRLELNASVPLEYLPERGVLTVGDASAVLYGNGRKILEAEMRPNAISRAGGLAEDLNFSLQVSPVALIGFNGLAPFEATGGEVSCNAEVTVGKEFNEVRSDGSVSVTGGGLRLPKWQLAGEALDVTSRFQFSFERAVGWALSAPDFACDMEKAPLLRTSFRLEKSLAGRGGTELNAEISECSSNIVELFGGKLRSRLVAAGRARLSHRGGGELNYSGGFEAKGTLPSGENLGVVCTLNIDGSPDGLVIRDTGMAFSGDSGSMGRVELSGTIPAEAAAPMRFDLKSEALLADKIFQLLGSGSEEEQEQREQEPEPVIHLGERPIQVDVALDDIRWGDNINATIHGHVNGEGRRLEFERFFLRFNGAELRASGELLGAPDRTAYHFAAEADDMEISAVLAPFMRERANSFSAATRHLKAEISGNSLASRGFWDTQTGALSAEFASVRLSHRLGETMIGRVLLLPFSIVLNVQDFLPFSWEALTGMTEITSLFKRFYDNTDAFYFDRGSLLLQSSGGRVEIREFELYGNPVNRFEFSGSFGLGSDRDLELRSEVDVMRLTIPVDIAGTLEKPAIDYAGITPNLIRANVDGLWRKFTPESWRR